MTNNSTNDSGPKRRVLFRVLLTPVALLAGGIAVGALTGRLPLMLTITAFAGGLALLLTVLRPDMALILFFCGTIMMTDAFGLSGKDCFTIPDADIIQGLPSALTIFFLLLFCIAMARTLFFEKRPLPVSLRGLGVYIVILLLALLTGLFRASDPGMIRVDLMKMLFPVLCFYLCITLLNNRERIKRMLMVLLAASALKALILDGFYLAGRGWPYDSMTGRIVTLDSADLLAFITLTLIAVHLLARRDIRGFQAGLVGAACIPMIFAIIFSYRRAQWAGMALSMGLLYLGAEQAVRRRIVIVVVIVLCIGGTVAVANGINKENLVRIGSRIATIFDPNQHSNLHHKLEAQQVMQDISRSPLLGLGFGSQHGGVAHYDSIPTNVVHNTFLYIWMKLGLPGMVFFLWASFLYGKNILRARKKYLHDETWGLLLPLAASSGLWLTMFLTSPIPWYLHQTFFKALVAAMVMSLILQADKNAKTQLEAGT